MFKQCICPLKAVAFIFGFLSYIVTASSLSLIHKIGLFTILCVFTSFFAVAMSKLNDGEDKRVS